MDPSHLYAALHGGRHLLDQHVETAERRRRAALAAREPWHRRAVRWFYGLRRPTPAPVAAAQQAGR